MMSRIMDDFLFLFYGGDSLVLNVLSLSSMMHQDIYPPRPTLTIIPEVGNNSVVVTEP